VRRAESRNRARQAPDHVEQAGGHEKYQAVQDDGGPFAVPGAERIGQHGSGERKQRDIHQEHGVQDE
jgi:hypothetical protein